MAATQAEECEDGGVVFRKSQSSSSRHQTRSFLNDGSQVSGVQDVLERMRNADNVEESGDSVEDREARALLNKFLGASVLMSGMESMMANSAKEEQSTTESGTTPGTKKVSKVTTTRTVKSTASSSSNAPKPSVENLEQIWDETVLKQLLDSSTSYEDRRKIRARLRQIMAEKEETTTTSSSKVQSQDGGMVTTRTTVTTKTVGPAKPMSAMAKFRQLDKQNSITSQSPPKTLR